MIRAIFQSASGKASKSYQGINKPLKKSITKFLELDLINNTVTIYSAETISVYDSRNYQEIL